MTKDGKKWRCGEKNRLWNRRSSLSGKMAVYQSRYYKSGKGRETDRRFYAKPEKAARHRAHNLCRKYGISLTTFEKMGVIPPDVQEALNGNR